jgi:N-acetylglutamate synthase-like GNAT family acetyltransferase
MIIRPYHPADAPQTAHLYHERAVILTQSDWRFSQVENAFDPAMLDELQQFVSEDGEKVVGVIACEIRDGIGVIMDMALDAHTYHSRLGSDLVHIACDWFNQQGITTVVARVPQFHAVEQAFWRALGAQEWKENLWSNNPPYIWMKLTFDQQP